MPQQPAAEGSTRRKEAQGGTARAAGGGRRKAEGPEEQLGGSWGVGGATYTGYLCAAGVRVRVLNVVLLGVLLGVRAAGSTDRAWEREREQEQRAAAGAGVAREQEYGVGGRSSGVCVCTVHPRRYQRSK